MNQEKNTPAQQEPEALDDRQLEVPTGGKIIHKDPWYKCLDCGYEYLVYTQLECPKCGSTKRERI